MIDGIAEYNLTANMLGNTLGDLALRVRVFYSVDIGFCPVDGPTVATAHPTGVELYIDGGCVADLEWKDVSGGLRAFVLKQARLVTLEEMGITDSEAREALCDEAEARQ
jgi:hypothetical protein